MNERLVCCLFLFCVKETCDTANDSCLRKLRVSWVNGLHKGDLAFLFLASPSLQFQRVQYLGYLEKRKNVFIFFFDHQFQVWRIKWMSCWIPNSSWVNFYNLAENLYFPVKIISSEKLWWTKKFTTKHKRIFKHLCLY